MSDPVFEQLLRIEDRIATIRDEACGISPVQSADDNLTAIERKLFEQRQEISRLERSRIEFRNALREAVSMLSDYGHRTLDEQREREERIDELEMTSADKPIATVATAGDDPKP